MQHALCIIEMYAIMRTWHRHPALTSEILYLASTVFVRVPRGVEWDQAPASPVSLSFLSR